MVRVEAYHLTGNHLEKNSNVDAVEPQMTNAQRHHRNRKALNAVVRRRCRRHRRRRQRLRRRPRRLWRLSLVNTHLINAPVSHIGSQLVH